LRLLETFALTEVAQAIDDALRMGTISFDAVKHLLLVGQFEFVEWDIGQSSSA
jgi:hypothetical protein